MNKQSVTIFLLKLVFFASVIALIWFLLSIIPGCVLEYGDTIEDNTKYLERHTYKDFSGLYCVIEGKQVTNDVFGTNVIELDETYYLEIYRNYNVVSLPLGCFDILTEQLENQYFVSCRTDSYTYKNGKPGYYTTRGSAVFVNTELNIDITQKFYSKGIIVEQIRLDARAKKDFDMTRGAGKPYG